MIDPLPSRCELRDRLGRGGLGVFGADRPAVAVVGFV
jgi:hypothetical protein